MSDVNVNINGRDGGLGDKLNKIRENIKGIATDVNRLPTEKKIDIRQTVKTSFEEQKASKQKEFDEARQANRSEFEDAQKAYKGGKMTAKDFEKHKNSFQESQTDLTKEEDKEMSDLQKQEVLLLRNMWREMHETNQLAKEKAKQETNKNQREIDANGILGKGKTADGKDAEDGSGGSWFSRFMSGGDKRRAAKLGMGTHGSEGGMNELAQGADQVMGSMGGAVGLARFVTGPVGVAIAAAVAVGAAVKSSFDLKEEEMKMNATRAGGTGGYNGLATISRDINSVAHKDELSDLDIALSDFVGKMGEVQHSTQNGRDLYNRTIEVTGAEKGYGLSNATQYMTYDRQFKQDSDYQKNSIDIAVDMLNVLGGIEQSSLKGGIDITNLGEKMGVFTKLNAMQTANVDAIDTKQTMKLMAAFETVGLSGKGGRQAEFLEGVTNGVQAGRGGSNKDLFIYEMTKRAHPELRNDPMAMQRMAEGGNGINTEQIGSMLEGIKKMSGKSKQNQQRNLMSMFPDMGWSDRDTLMKAMESPDAMKFLKGKSLDITGKESKEQMIKGAKDVNTNELSSEYQSFKNSMVASTDRLMDFFRKGEANVNIVTKNTAGTPNATR